MKIAVKLALVWLGVAVGIHEGSLAAATRQVDPAKLRELLRVPPLSVEMGFNLWDVEDGYLLNGEPIRPERGAPLPERIEAMQRELRRDDSDAARYLRIARWQARLGKEAEAREAWEKAASAARDGWSGTTNAGWSRSLLGQALQGLGQDEAGEEQLRSAVQLSPGDWRCWDALGHALSRKAVAALGPVDLSGLLRDDGQMPPAFRELPAGRIEECRRWFDEARDCFDRSVKAAGDLADAYSSRLTFGMGTGTLLGRLFEDDSRTRPPGLSGLLTPEVLADLRTVARLTTNEMYAIGMSAIYEGMAGWDRQSASGGPEQSAWNSISESGREHVRTCLGRLRTFAEGPDPQLAAAALAATAVVEMVLMRDPARAEAGFRRSVRVNPLPEKPWEGLFGTLVVQEHWDELATACRERLALKESPRVRIMLAKALERMGEREAAENELEAVLKYQPRHDLVRIGLLNLQLRRADDEAALEEIGRLLNELARELGSRKDFREGLAFEMLRGFWLGLAGQTSEARKVFQRIESVTGGNPDARAAIEALGNE